MASPVNMNLPSCKWPRWLHFIQAMLWSVLIPPSSDKTRIVYPLQLPNVNVLIRVSLHCNIFGKVSKDLLHLHSSAKLELWRRLTTDNQNLKESQSENKEPQSSNPISLAFSATGVLARCVLIVIEWLRENAIVFATGASLLRLPYGYGQKLQTQAHLIRAYRCTLQL